MIKKVHSKQKSIDINFNRIKIYIITFALFLSACDFRLPQDWETPSWELPLSIPLFNDIITMYDLIDTSGSDLTLDSNDYSINTSLVMIYEPCPEIDDPLYNAEDICCVETLDDYDPYAESCPVRVFISDEYFNVDEIRR